MKSDALYLSYSSDAIRKIGSYTMTLDKEQFMQDGKTQSAVILQLLLVGEIAKKLSDETRTAIQLPWKEIIGFRDRAIHNYYDIDLDIVWETVMHDVPALKNSLARSV